MNKTRAIRPRGWVCLSGMPVQAKAQLFAHVKLVLVPTEAAQPQLEAKEYALGIAHLWSVVALVKALERE